MIRQFNSAPNMELLFVRSQLSVLPCQLAESSAAEIKKGEKKMRTATTLKEKLKSAVLQPPPLLAGSVTGSNRNGQGKDAVVSDLDKP
jgi:hypothetical protein